ncbi:hypothetical protein C8R42DRAFT_568727 [Lentinula raphanica]|nr:hypothetical protein C8R42DRAFT_568727 [Lentinula raphanica]
MVAAGITSADVFYGWLVEEGEYLRNLTQTPPKETLEMEYFAKLAALRICEDRLQQARSAWLAYIPEKDTAAARRKVNSLIADVQALEQKLGITARWAPGCDEWESAKKMVKEADYRRALDRLEQLLVSRIFEMSRLNIGGTGKDLTDLIYADY